MSLSKGGLGGFHCYSSACYIRSVSALSIHQHLLHSIDDFNQSIPSSKAIAAESIINTHYAIGGCAEGGPEYIINLTIYGEN